MATRFLGQKSWMDSIYILINCCCFHFFTVKLGAEEFQKSVNLLYDANNP